MRISHIRPRYVAYLFVLAAAVVAAGAPSAGLATPSTAAKCEEGPTKVGGTWWVQYCGPATSTARFSGKTVRFSSGSCKTTQRGVLILYIGRRTFRGLSPKTKYWELVSVKKGDGVYRKDVFIEWWLGKTHYVLGDLKVTFRNGMKQATYTGTLLSGAKGKASGTFKC